MKNFVVFDLDGTLIDTLTGLTEAVNETLKELSLPYSYKRDEVMTFIGRGAKRLFNLATKNENNPAEFALFLKNYEKHQYISEPYDHVLETLKELEKRKICLIIYSNKPNNILNKLIENKLNKINFLYVQGQDNNYPPKPDVTLLKSILNKFNLKPEDGLYVGDSIVDIETARNIKMKVAILSYGYGNKEEIKEAKPDYYLDDFKEILEVLWQKNKSYYLDYIAI